MRNTKNIIKTSTIGIAILFFISALLSCLANSSPIVNLPVPLKQNNNIVSNTAEITCYTIGLQSTISIKKTTISRTDAQWVIDNLQSLKKEVARNPQSEKIKNIQSDLLMFSDMHHLLPSGVTAATVQAQSMKTPVIPYTFAHRFSSPRLQGKASKWFCNLISAGDDSTLPIIILPRFIPFLVTPIPRAFIWWSTPAGYTSVGGLLSNTGFIAVGEQKGIALGFWGIGFSIFLPPIHSYGLFGYAVYSRVTAAQLEFWPPNNLPEITQIDPVDGQQMVSMSTSELRFNIQDADGDLMTYNVFTEPNIGSGSGGLKPDGTYSVHVSGLNSNTQYTWHIQVTDGEDTVEETLTFTTEPVGPAVSDPYPADGERQVPSDFAALRFYIMDFQGYAMDYTVETSPSIGSAHVTRVHDGTYTVPVSGVQLDTAYRWFINVTDGPHVVRKIFSFKTGFPAHFDPFEYGWQYRKQVTIDHAQVAGDLENFPVLLNITDADLSQKARVHGEDILFMSGMGVSSRFNYEIESFNHDTGALIAWMNISHLLADQDTVFYMYYGNPSCLPQQYPEKTWDSHYLAVWHMEDAVGAEDSNNDHNASPVIDPLYQITGKIGYAETFSGSQYMSIANPQTMVGLNAITIETWTKINSDSTGTIIANTYDGHYPGEAWRFDYFSGGNLLFRLGHSTPSNQEGDAVATGISTGAWYHFTGTWTNGNKLNIYKNGIFSANSPSTFTGMINRPDTDAFMGAMHKEHSEIVYYLYGTLDEIRISDIERTPAWISTSYTNQYNPSAFLCIGPEVPGL